MSRSLAKAKPGKRAKATESNPRVKSSATKRANVRRRKAKNPSVGLHQPVLSMTTPPQEYIELAKGRPPLTIDDLPWPKQHRNQLANFVKKGGGNLLLAGWYGLGKTEAVNLLIRLMDLDVVKVDASDDVTLQALKDAKISALYPSLLGNAKRAVIIDEACTYGVKALQSLRGDTMNSPDAMFIIICNDVRKIPDAVLSRCEKIIFDVNDRELKREVKLEQQRRVREILDREGVQYKEQDIAAAWADNPNADIREGLRVLESLVNGEPHPVHTTGASGVAVFAPGDAPPLVPDFTSLAPKQRETAEIFYLLKAEFQKYLVLPDGGAAALAVFVMHAYAHDAADFSPILAITSPQRSCGKSETLELLRILIAGALSTVNITPAAMFELADDGTPLLIDEADRFLKPGSDLIQLLNGGVKRGAATVYRAGHKKYRVWCPKVIARIGRITPDTLASRCIDIRMKRAMPNDQTAVMPLDQQALYRGLRQQCEAWAFSALNELRIANPTMPSEFQGRLADKWRALFAIGDFAGLSVAQEIRAAATAIESDGDIDEDHGTLLLEDIRKFFDDSGDTSISSAELVEELRRQVDRPWSVWPRGLDIRVARILADYGIRPENIRKNGKQRKGYHRWKFEDAFKRYVPAA